MVPEFETQYVSALAILFSSLDEEKENGGKEEVKLLIRKELKKRKAELTKSNQEQVDFEDTNWPLNIVDDMLEIRSILQAKLVKYEHGLAKTNAKLAKLEEKVSELKKD